MNSAQLYNRYCELQRYVNWNADDARHVHSLHPVASRHFERLVDDFYEAIQGNPSTSKVITGGAEQIVRLKGTLIKWLEELFSGKYDEDYVLRRWKVGLRHVEIGLDQAYTNAALSRLRSRLLLALEQAPSINNNIFEARRSLNKLLDLDLAIIEDAYQTEREQRLQLIERLAAIGQVAGGIAHELRNPLNVIKTSTYYLRNAQKVSAEKQNAHLERIDRQATLADNVIGALNDFARMPFPEMKQLEVAATIKEVVELITLPGSIGVKFEIPDGLFFLADPQQIAIVYTNLICNARDAMPNGGTITISAIESGAFVQTDIADTGFGIPAETIGRIMEPLFSTKARGIGLGLAISRAIVERHGGELKVTSEVGAGAVFTVRLRPARKM